MNELSIFTKLSGSIARLAKTEVPTMPERVWRGFFAVPKAARFTKKISSQTCPVGSLHGAFDSTLWGANAMRRRWETTTVAMPTLSAGYPHGLSRNRIKPGCSPIHFELS